MFSIFGLIKRETVRFNFNDVTFDRLSERAFQILKIKYFKKFWPISIFRGGTGYKRPRQNQNITRKNAEKKCKIICLNPADIYFVKFVTQDQRQKQSIINITTIKNKLRILMTYFKENAKQYLLHLCKLPHNKISLGLNRK